MAAAVERIVTTSLTLAAPADHILQHCTSDDVPGVASTEQNPTLNTFRDNHVLRVKEVRADRNAGKIKTTSLVVSNGNFSASYGDPDSYGDKLHSFVYAERKGAATIRSGGCYIGDGLRVGGVVGAPTFVNDIANPEDPNTRIRTYLPSMNAPYFIYIFMLIVNEQTSVIDSGIELGDHFKLIVDIPPDVYFVCQRNDGPPRITAQIVPVDNFGSAFHAQSIGLEDHQFLVRATRFGTYKCILYAERNDSAANANKFAEYAGTCRYFPAFRDVDP